MRLIIAAAAVASLLATTAGADVVSSFGSGSSDGANHSRRFPDIEADELYGANPMLPLSSLEPLQLQRFLTFLKEEADRDKDGFVNSPIVGRVNPAGYVVFHFRSMWLNERVSLGAQGGDLLAVSMRTMGGGGGPNPDPLPLGSDGPGPGPSPAPDDPPAPPKGPEPTPPTPEPSTTLLLLAGAGAAGLKRRRTAQRL